MKKKRICKWIFHGFIICTSIILGLFSQNIYSQNIKEFQKSKLISYSYDIYDNVVIYNEMKLNPDYSPLTFSEKVDKKLQKEILEAFTKSIKWRAKEVENDVSFHYLIKDNTTGKEIKNYKNLSGKYIFEGKIAVTENQVVNCSGDFKNLNLIEDVEPSHYVYDSYVSKENYDEQELEKILNYFYNEEIVFNMPQNIEIEFKLDQDIALNSYYYDINQSITDEISAGAFAIVTGILVCVMILFVFFMKYEVELEMAPFIYIQNWIFEVSFILLVSLATVTCLVAVTTSTALALSTYEFLPQWLFVFIGIVCWMAFQYTMASCLFVVKSIFKKGIKSYIKENTIIGKIVTCMIRDCKKILQADLSLSIYKKVILLVIINLVLVLMVSLFKGFGFILDIVFIIAFAVYVLKNAKEVKQDYADVLEKSNELANGSFIQKEHDYGIFNEFGKSLDLIQESFEKAVKEEVKSQDMKNELISNVSHDLKTPLTCIKNYTMLLQEENLDEETRKEYLKNLDFYSNRMQICIQDLFDISKVNSQTIVLHKTKLDLIALMKQELVECEEYFKHKNLHLIDNTKGSAFVELDGEKTVRILENLFINISKYALDASRVYIDMKVDDESISLIFKNISQEAMNFTPEEIVERFVRGDKSRHETGSGLGLAIVKSFTEVQNGSFDIKIEGDLFMTILTFPLFSNGEK